MKTLTASIVFAVLASAGCASADGIHIPVLGKAPASLHTEIARAARQVCSDAAFDLSSPASEDACIAASVAKAEIDARLILTSPNVLAA